MEDSPARLFMPLLTELGVLGIDFYKHVAPNGAHLAHAQAFQQSQVIYSSPSGQIIIVGGQAVNFWADRYTPDEPKLLAYLPFTSRDLDLLASITNAYRLASETRGSVEKPPRAPRLLSASGG